MRRAPTTDRMIVFGGSYLKIGNDGSFTFGFAHDVSSDALKNEAQIVDRLIDNDHLVGHSKAFRDGLLSSVNEISVKL
jgi:hypothetical protein